MFRPYLPFVSVFILVQWVTRFILWMRAEESVHFSFSEATHIISMGLWFDVVTLCFALLPVALIRCVMPNRYFLSVLGRFLYISILLFTAVSEQIFWTEFTARFNFIAVDYLVYTHEVIQNIIESYPVIPIVAAIGLTSLIFTFITLKIWPTVELQSSRKGKVAAFLVILVTAFSGYQLADAEQAVLPEDTVASELAGNGYYSLFYAFKHNEIHYERFYATRPHHKIADILRNLLTEENQSFISSKHDDLRRSVKSSEPEKHFNVMLVIMESMSAEYMAHFGNQRNLTPHLDALADKGLFFSNTYATGTRTVRGLEAITLSIPPTPGQSIVRRPHNENLFSLGAVMQDHGYKTRFIYGGYGYFDNMNAFFSGNHFEVTDRTDIAHKNIHFSNVWGICDEDLFDESLRLADDSHKNGTPFLHLMMTTSNHRPFTYPDNKINIPSKSGREGGVKYADYSIGQFMKKAKQKPWYKDTVFVFVADHTAGAGGKMDFDANRYHIPMIFYSPKHIPTQQFKAIASQIDASPILLGLLDFSYTTKFYGEDLLHDPDEIPHAFISTYQKVGLIKNNNLTVLEPRKHIMQYQWPELHALNMQDAELIDETIGFYQSASWWKKTYRNINTPTAR